MTHADNISPVAAKERHVVLDALRGFALLGICLANYPEFSLYTFQSAQTVAEMPTAGIDAVLRFLMRMFVDGKFYTLFSLLFGIGFSIIIANAARKGGNGMVIFYRRMLILTAIGFLHLMFIWSGDILMLYALMGMLLPLFRRCADKTLLGVAGFFLLLPIAVDTLTALAGVSLSAPALRAQWDYCRQCGITEENFGYWLRDAQNYGQVFDFLVQGALVRVQEFVDGNRYFKVFGLFLVGFYIGRNRLYANLDERRPLLKKVAAWGFGVGLPMSVLYAIDGTMDNPLGLPVYTVLYTVSVYPTGMAYMAAIGLVFSRRREFFLWRWLAAPGRMALSNYIGQSAMGMVVFYGIGLGLGASVGLVQTLGIAVAVYLGQMAVSAAWLRGFRFGPLEWVWRMLTYGRWLDCRNEKEKK